MAEEEMRFMTMQPTEALQDVTLARALSVILKRFDETDAALRRLEDCVGKAAIPATADKNGLMQEGAGVLTADAKAPKSPMQASPGSPPGSTDLQGNDATKSPSSDLVRRSKQLTKKFEPLEGWKEFMKNDMLHSHISHRFHRPVSYPELEQLGGYESGKSQQTIEPDGPWYVLRPGNRNRLIWDILCMFFVFWDLVTIPMQLSFRDLATSQVLLKAAYVTLTFWTIDIPLSFITGFYVAGEEELRLKEIAKHYLKTWLVIDVIVVSVDYVATVFKYANFKGAAMLRIGKALKSLRILRSLRLLRLVKVKKAMEDIQDRVQSEFVGIIITVSKYTCLIVMLNHLIACAWFALGRSSDDFSGWTNQEYFSSWHEWHYKYLTSLHWSLTQFTPASMEVHPYNLKERLFAVIVLIFALIVFSSFVSGITTSMTALRSLHGAVDRNMSILRRYLRLKGISTDLSQRIQRYVEHQVSRRELEIQESRVVMLDLLSQPLRFELTQEILSPILKSHPFFVMYESLDSEAMKLLCSCAIHKSSYSAGDYIFHSGSQGDSMIFIMKGYLRYFPERAEKKHHQQQQQQANGSPQLRTKPASSTIRDGSWCCEAALWTKWVHIGTAVGVSNSELLMLNAAAFAKVSSEHYRVMRFATRYAMEFIANLNSQDWYLLSDLPDEGPAAAENMVSSMIEEEQKKARGSKGVDDDEDDDAGAGARLSAVQTINRLMKSGLLSDSASEANDQSQEVPFQALNSDGIAPNNVNIALASENQEAQNGKDVEATCGDWIESI